MQRIPRVPLRADQLAGDSVARVGSKVHTKPRPFFERHTAPLGLLNSFLVKTFTDFLRTSFEHFVKQSRVKRAGRDGVHVDTKVAQFFRKRFGQPYDARF